MCKRFKRYNFFFLAVAALLLTAGCATNKNTARSRWWQSFNTRYNVYYNGAQSYIEGSLEREAGNHDNFTEMLPMYTVANKSNRELGKADFARSIEKARKAIRLHSIKRRPEWTKSRRKTARDIEWLNRKEYNPFLWKAWLLLGRAQFMSGDFDEAASTFAYMSRLYATQPAIYGRARAWLAKCYTEGGWLYDAEDVITKIRRAPLHWRAVKEWDNAYADFFLRSGRYEEAVPYLRKAISHEMRRKQRARLWYILGQAEAELGHRNAAFRAFKHVVRLNPPYELAFNARISMTEVLAGQHSEKMIKRLRRMSFSENNKDYQEQIFYAIGNIYMNRRDTTRAIAAYETGRLRATRSGIEKGVLLLRLGDLYWSREDYGNSRSCYDAALGLIDKEHKDYKRLSKRSKVLDELVPNIESVHLQDSLQTLASMSERDRNAAIDRAISALKKKEKEQQAVLAVASAQQEGGAQTAETAVVNGGILQSSAQNQSSTWYFYNPLAVSRGKATFQKLWGRRENVDNWQRINKTVVALDDAFSEPAEAISDSVNDIAAGQTDSLSKSNTAQSDPYRRDYYLAQIPFTPEQKMESDKITAESLLNAGIIFKDRMGNLGQSECYLRRLTDSYEDYGRMDYALYHLYLLYLRRGNTSQAEAVLERMRQVFSDSKWTVMLADPYYEENARAGIHIEDSLYAAAYNAFKAGRYTEVQVNTALSAKRFPMGANRDKFLFIGGLARLNSGDAAGCLADMETVVKQYPQSDVSTMAGMIINGVKAGRQLRGGSFDIGSVWRRRTVAFAAKDSADTVKFKGERNTDFVFLIAFNPDSVDANKLLFELARYNFTNFLVRDFNITTDQQNGLSRMVVSGFRNYDEALQYARRFYENKTLRKMTSHGRTIIISRDNMRVLGTQLSYADYDVFYEQSFAPLHVTTEQLLMEPETIEYLPQAETPRSEAREAEPAGAKTAVPPQEDTGIYFDDDPPAPQPAKKKMKKKTQKKNDPATEDEYYDLGGF